MRVIINTKDNGTIVHEGIDSIVCANSILLLLKEDHIVERYMMTEDVLYYEVLK